MWSWGALTTLEDLPEEFLLESATKGILLESTTKGILLESATKGIPLRQTYKLTDGAGATNEKEKGKKEKEKVNNKILYLSFIDLLVIMATAA